ncbi:Uncharacterised protein [Streptococcus pneumoniae]|nr:Uncharacterised protein [Streptococcus pneumoniae]CXF63784.1 Uncharacterised protein [Streptococcus pneumoniae]CXF83123.1 Uncharacterised protein [Streptococcus pneumoniae]CYI33446.1 Uncharacterised protein [Streptococcus pneumoniae]VNW00666.1 Uncharacterised protein [Streptococcus pneumoniae]
MSFQYVHVGMLVLIWGGEQNPLLIEDKLVIRLVCLFVNCSGLI